MDKVTSYIKECETEFMQLLGLTSFPIYEIAYKDISLSVSDEQGYDSLGSAHYDYKTGKHTLTVWSNIHTLGEVGKQTIFHEFTHILDDETYVNKDPEKYIANHGYTEYHAAQIGFLKVLGVKSIKQNISFSMNYRTEEEAEKYLGTPIYSRFSKVVIFNPISVDDKLKIARKCYAGLMAQVDAEDKALIENNSVLSLFERVIKEGAYPNMRMLRNDIEDAINFEILKARGIIQ